MENENRFGQQFDLRQFGQIAQDSLAANAVPDEYRILVGVGQYLPGAFAGATTRS